MRQRYLRLISVLLLLAILTACGTDISWGETQKRTGTFLVRFAMLTAPVP